MVIRMGRVKTWERKRTTPAASEPEPTMTMSTAFTWLSFVNQPSL